MQPIELLMAYRELRANQRTYFNTRSPDALKLCKQQERKLDLDVDAFFDSLDAATLSALGIKRTPRTPTLFDQIDNEPGVKDDEPERILEGIQ